VDLRSVLLLDDRDYRFPRDKKRVADALKDWGAILLVLDPVDSYMEDGVGENDGPDVRDYLESLHWIAVQAGAAVVGVRHPGKDPRNLMPGSRQWRNVPRSIVLQTIDTSFPPKRYMVHHKDSYGNDEPPHRYGLEGKPGQPRRFVMEGRMDHAVVRLSSEVSDPTDRMDIRLAGRILRRLMTKETEPTVEDLKNECMRNGVSDRARKTAAQLLGMNPRPREGAGKWYMFRTATDWPAWTDEDHQ
jgi:hypothetical protein